ncbi:amidohydrolase [Acetobacter tropicalis NRIC 0312]|uniref:Organophopsphate acid anhydrase n=1 Tax=Acetobacter tropicalis TaxID=104102 RepID=A0A511FKE5_9PROT|nr:amidohydrolase family protein [Acetobacter tropicalis]GAL96610.1 amidohydrolase [Acetobacter tropicalis]GBR66698.1 amidohydrolase [Acetobacter tropicalis NRIC 0312]GEL49696.1 organophopsphate acid anhydrase [Acetobacter tropicalis]
MKQQAIEQTHLPSQKKQRRLCSCFSALLLAGASSFMMSGLPAEAATATTPVLLDHVRLFDGTDSPEQEDMAVLVKGQSIAAVGHSGTVKAPKGTKRIDLSGKTLIPGLITNHSHVGVVSGTKVGAENFTVPVIKAALDQYERYGVTTVTALGLTKSPLFDDLRKAQHANTDGADLFGVDQGIGVPGGMPPEGMVKVGKDQIFRPSTAEEARQAVDTMVSEGTDMVKLWVDDFRNGVKSAKPLPVMKPEVWQAVMAEAHAKNVRVAVHIHDLAYAKKLVSAGADIIAHGVRDEPVDDELISLMKSHNVWYVPTISLDEATYLFAEQPALLNDPVLKAGLSEDLTRQFSDAAWRDKIVKSPLDAASHKAVAMNEQNLLALYKAGVKIGFGTDSGAAPVRIPGFAEHRELRLLVEAGLTPLQALRLATSQAAALLNLSDRGVIAPGKRADFVVLEADPAQNIAAVDQISAVWRGGVRADGPLVPR